MMQFITDTTKHHAFSKRLNQTGTLTLMTRITIQGNYKEGPVPVSIAYEISFVPDEEYWEKSSDYPDEERYPETWLNSFESGEERKFALQTYYEMK